MFTQVKILFLQWLPCVLRMSRPGKKITKKTILMSNRMKELELQERSSKSLLANVLDIDDDFRHGNSAANPASGYIRYTTSRVLSVHSIFSGRCVRWKSRPVIWHPFSPVSRALFSPRNNGAVAWWPNVVCTRRWNKTASHFNPIARESNERENRGVNAYNNPLWAIGRAATSAPRTNVTRADTCFQVNTPCCT